MSQPSAILAVIAILTVALGILVTLLVRKRRKERKIEETSYRAFFVMGTAMFPAGIVGLLIFLMLGVSFIIAMPILSLGLIYLIIGVANRDKWKKAS